MDLVAERKAGVLKRLNKETESLAALKDLTNRSANVAGGMVTLLDSFEHRLAKLETTILPVYQQTGNLQRRHQNIEKTLAALDHVLAFYNAAGESEGVIRGGRPGETGRGVSEYIEAMDKLASAAEYFNKHNPHSVELSNVNTLFSAGAEALGREFRDELMKYQRPLNPIVVLDLVALEGEELSEEALSSIELIPPNAVADLSLIAAWLDTHDQTDKLVVYAKIRAQALSQTLQALKDHQRNNSAERGGIRGLGSLNTPGAASSLTPTVRGLPANSPAPTLRSRLGGNKLDATPKSRGHKISNMLERRAHSMLQRAKGKQALMNTATNSPFSPYTPTSPFTPGGTSTSSSNTLANEEVLDVTDVLLHLTQVTALSRLGLLEHRLLDQIVPSERQGPTLSILLRAPLDQLLQQGQHISSVGVKSMQRGDSSSVLCLLLLLRHLTQTGSEYQRLLNTKAMMAKYEEISANMQTAVVECLDIIMEGVRGESVDKQLPKDGTVHQQTSNILIFLQQLQEYTACLGPILLKDATLRTSASVTVLSGDSLTLEQSQALVAAYFKRVLSNLGASIMQRSEAYSDNTLKAIFRLNNYNYLLTTLLSTSIMEVLEMVEPGARQYYTTQILQQKKLYQQSWSGVLAHLTMDEEVGQLQAGKMRDRDRQMLKDKFSGFNKEIEDMQRTQRSYSIPDRKLRDGIKRDNKEYILPKYQAFYDSFSSVPFSRNSDKYIKHSPADVASLMDKFFDVAA